MTADAVMKTIKAMKTMQTITCIPHINAIMAAYQDKGYLVIDTTSHNPDPMMKSLSPFFLRTLRYPSVLMENLWQYSKIYKDHYGKSELLPTEDAILITYANETMKLPGIIPCKEFFDWSRAGFKNQKAVRHPMGREIPICAIIQLNGRYCCMDYIQSRKLLYVPHYSQSVIRTESYARLYDTVHRSSKPIALADFDGYDTNDSFETVLNNPRKRMGHSFVLADLLRKNIRPYTDVNRKGKEI